MEIADEEGGAVAAALAATSRMPQGITSQEQSSQLGWEDDKVLYVIEDVEMVKPKGTRRGRLEVTSSSLCFYPNKPDPAESIDLAEAARRAPLPGAPCACASKGQDSKDEIQVKLVFDLTSADWLENMFHKNRKGINIGAGTSASRSSLGTVRD